MVEPRNIHELKSLQWKLAYLRRFISNLAGKCKEFSCLMKKALFSNEIKLIIMPLRASSIT